MNKYKESFEDLMMAVLLGLFALYVIIFVSSLDTAEAESVEVEVVSDVEYEEDLLVQPSPLPMKSPEVEVEDVIDILPASTLRYEGKEMVEEPANDHVMSVEFDVEVVEELIVEKEETTYVALNYTSGTDGANYDLDGSTDSGGIQDSGSSNSYPHSGLASTDLEMLACIVYREMGSDYCCDECRRRVADVVLNRVADSRFPNSIAGVLMQSGQYGLENGVSWPSRASYASESAAVERAYRIAQEVLSGQHSDIYGAGYVWQAGFAQGSTWIYHCGTYFGA